MYCGVEGRGGGVKILQKMMATPLSVIKMIKYGIVAGGGGALKFYKKIIAPPLFIIKIVNYCGVGGRQGGGQEFFFSDLGICMLLLHALC